MLMDKRKLGKVVRDVKKILVLAKSAHDHLEKNQIRKAKRELKKVINYDADEITRLNDEAEEGAVQQLLHECGIVLKDAKQSLRDLDSSELFDNAKELVDEIVALEGHELMELEEEERRENSLYHFWYNSIRTNYLFHGTISLALPKIEKYGLVPRMRPWDPYDWKRFSYLYRKGTGAEFSKDYSESDSEDPLTSLEAIHLTTSKNLAVLHAKSGAPAAWLKRFWQDWEKVEHRYGKGVYLKRNRINAERTLSRSLAGSLKKEELNECLRLFRKLWDLFDTNSQPILIYVNPKSSAIRKQFGLLFVSFSYFLEWRRKNLPREWDDHNLLEVWERNWKVRPDIAFDQGMIFDIKVKSRIPRKDIVRIEKT